MCFFKFSVCFFRILGIKTTRSFLQEDSKAKAWSSNKRCHTEDLKTQRLHTVDPSEFRPENDQLIIPSNGRFSLKANQKETNHDFLFFQNKVLCLFSQTDCFMDFSTKTPSHLTSLSSWNLESGEMWNVDFKSATTPSTPSTAFNQLPKDKTATQQGL